MNTLNLPLAFITVVLRRYIDKLLTSQGANVLNNAAWIVQPSLFKLCMYGYMFSAGLWYTMRNMRKGTVVSLAKKCSGSAVNVRYPRNRCLDKNRKPSWMMANLLKNRESQQRALEYVSSLTPHPKPSSRECNMGEPSRCRDTRNYSVCPKSNRNTRNYNGHQNSEASHDDCLYYSSFNNDPTFENHHGMISPSDDSNDRQCEIWRAPQHRGDAGRNPSAFNNQQNEPYGSNPYFEPKMVPYARPNPCVFSNPQSDFNPSNPDSRQGPSNRHCYTEEQCAHPNIRDAPDTWWTNPTEEAKSEHSVLAISDDSTSALLKVDTKTKKRKRRVPAVRNLYTLRGRKINTNVANQEGKTRSGKDYSDRLPKSRRKNR